MESRSAASLMTLGSFMITRQLWRSERIPAPASFGTAVSRRSMRSSRSDVSAGPYVPAPPGPTVDETPPPVETTVIGMPTAGTVWMTAQLSGCRTHDPEFTAMGPYPPYPYPPPAITNGTEAPNVRPEYVWVTVVRWTGCMPSSWT